MYMRSRRTTLQIVEKAFCCFDAAQITDRPPVAAFISPPTHTHVCRTTLQIVEEAFCCFDASEDGYLEREEVEQALTTTSTPGRCAYKRGLWLQVFPCNRWAAYREAEHGAPTAHGTKGFLSSIAD